MPQVSNDQLKDLLSGIQDPGLRAQLEESISGVVVAEVRCLSEDIEDMVEVPVTDKKGEPVLKLDGTPKTKQEKQIVRPGCKGRVIGHRMNSGNWVDVPNSSPKWGLNSTRARLDGQMGFSCRCGQYSIVAEAEDGVIGGSVPRRDDLIKVHQNLQKKPTKVTRTVDGATEVDGFKVTETGGII